MTTVVPALGGPRRERPPAVYGHFVNVPTHFNVKLPLISGHLPNADADSHFLVVSTCYNGHCKQMPRFRWSFQPKITGAHTNLGPTVRSKCGKNANGTYDIEANTELHRCLRCIQTFAYCRPAIPQLLCCMNFRFTTIAYIIMTMRVFVGNIAGGDSSR